jgi:hypothetical protein
MPSTTLKTQVDDLEGTIDDARQILEDAYTPEATRTELVNAVSQAIDLLSGEEDEDEDEDEVEDDESD